MHIIIGLAFAMFVLWLWLAGHWFGRVLAFLMFSVLGIVIAGAIAENAHAGNGTLWILFIGSAFGIFGAWFLASVPIQYRARKV